MVRKIEELIAPLGPVVAFVYSVYDPRGYVAWGWYVFYFLFAAFFSYLGFFLLGMPFISYLRNRGYYNLIPLIICGAVAGLVAIYLIILIFGTLLGSLPMKGFFSLETSLWGIKSGITVSVTYWLINKLNQ